jgi:hypothetical protein
MKSSDPFVGTGGRQAGSGWPPEFPEHQASLLAQTL